METTRKPLPKYVIAIIAVAGALVLFLILYFAIPCKVTYVHSSSRGVLSEIAHINSGDNSVKVTRTSRFTPIVPTTRDGYAFKGWFVDSACTIPWVSGDRVTHNITLYAKWEPTT